MVARIAAVLTVCLIRAHTALASAITPSAVPYAVVPSAYQVAAATAGIPPQLLWALSLQESGWLRQSRVVPWPWTLNIAGVPARFATRAGACRALHQALKKVSPRRIDIGLTQVNWGYHPERFRNPCELLDPYRNLAAASRLLVELHRDGESWVSTAARYHRPARGDEASRYGTSLQLRLAHLRRDDAGSSPTPNIVARVRP